MESGALGPATYRSVFECRTFCAESRSLLREAASLSLRELIVNENLISTSMTSR
jgi:hypothetical protein